MALKCPMHACRLRFTRYVSLYAKWGQPSAHACGLSLQLRGPLRQAWHPSAPCVCAGSMNSYVSLYAKWGQPPGWSYGQSDFHGAGTFSAWGSSEAAYELKFDASDPEFQPGKPPACPDLERSWRATALRGLPAARRSLLDRRCLHRPPKDWPAHLRYLNSVRML